MRASSSAGAQELDLVDQEDDAHALILGRLADGDEQVGQVLGQNAAVAPAVERLDVETGGHARRRC